MANDLRLMIVDDSAVFRLAMSDILKSIPGVTVVGAASNGKIALEKIPFLKPDVVTLDIEMPVMGGVETLGRLKTDFPDCSVIMVSAFTDESARTTIEALNIGAVDFVTKPTGTDVNENLNAIEEQIRPIVEGLRFTYLPGASAKMRPTDQTSEIDTRELDAALARLREGIRPAIIAMGASTGGPRALGRILPSLPGDFPLPIVVVQHMPPVFTGHLASSLNARSAIRVVEAAHDMIIKAGTAYIAPGGVHMKVAKGVDGFGNSIVLADGPPVNNSKPSVDTLFASVAALYKSRAAGVVLTGMGRDGVWGLHAMKKHQARVIAQDENTSVVFGMPMEAIAAGVVDTVLPLERIAEEIVRLST